MADEPFVRGTVGGQFLGCQDRPRLGEMALLGMRESQDQLQQLTWYVALAISFEQALRAIRLVAGQCGQGCQQEDFGVGGPGSQCIFDHVKHMRRALGQRDTDAIRPDPSRGTFRIRLMCIDARQCGLNLTARPTGTRASANVGDETRILDHCERTIPHQTVGCQQEGRQRAPLRREREVRHCTLCVASRRPLNKTIAPSQRGSARGSLLWTAGNFCVSPRGCEDAKMTGIEKTVARSSDRLFRGFGFGRLRHDPKSLLFG